LNFTTGGIYFKVKEDEDEWSISKVLWKYARNSIIHEAELDNRIRFSNDATYAVNNDIVTFPKRMIWALAFLITTFKCFEHWKINDASIIYSINDIPYKIPLCTLWGAKEKLKEYIEINVFDKYRAIK
jgi:hypothetical protein